MSDGDVPLVLSSDEALVLFEFLSRFVDTDRLEIIDQAEEVALWRLLGNLEKVLVVPFQPDYHDRLRQARDRLRHEPG